MIDSHIPNFLNQCIIIDNADGDGLDVTALYGLYVSWCLTGGSVPMVNSVFVTALRHHGVEHDDDRGTIRFYPGLKMVDPMSRGDVLGAANN